MKILNRKNLCQTKLATAVAMAIGLSSVIAVPAFSQDNESTDEEMGWLLEEIIVTATKRETTLQDTALSVSVISGDDLSKMGITSFDQILATVPGVTVIETGPGNNRVVYRGITSGASGFDVNAATATYLDEFPLGVKDIDIKLIDMARIEALKGPQGTLYGQSSLGGVIRYITNKPNFDAVSGGIEGSVTSVESGGSGYRGQGYVNIPLSDNLAVRAVFYNYDNPGFIDNLGTGTKDQNSEEVTGGRLALRWDISEQAAFNLLYLNQSQRANGGMAVGVQMPTSPYTPVLSGAPTDVGPVDLDNPSIRANIDPFADRDWEVLNLKLDINFEDFDLSLMGATKQREWLRVVDFGMFFNNYDGVSAVRNELNIEDAETKTFEGRLVSTGDGPLEWLAGVWYETDEDDGASSGINQIQTPRTDLVLFGLPWADGDFATNRRNFRDSEELSVYGEVGYRFTDQAKLTLGYRRTDLKLDSGVLSATGVFKASALAQSLVDESTEEDVNTYKINFEYRFNDDLLAYALAASGYRAGGFNRSGPLDVSPASAYGTDTLWNYELGVRSSWLDNRLTANAVAYYIDWSELQLRSWDTDSLSSKVQNVGEAEVFGLETEISYQATDHLSLSVNYAYTDASLAEDYLDESTSPATVLASDGTRLPGSSKHAVSLFVDWQRPLTASIDLLLNASYRYASSRPNILGSAPGLFDSFPEDLPSTNLVNLSAGVSHESGVTASLFANNLFDERNAQFRAEIGTALQGVSMNRPRTMGLRVGYQF